MSLLPTFGYVDVGKLFSLRVEDLSPLAPLCLYKLLALLVQKYKFSLRVEDLQQSLNRALIEPYCSN